MKHFSKTITKTCIILLMLILPVLVSAHGVKIKFKKQSPVVLVQARYHGGKKLTNARVTVKFIDNNKKKQADTIFQQGQTDKNGKFCFLPGQTGQWTVIVDDMMGHRGKATVTLETAFFQPPPAAAASPGKAGTPKNQPETQPPASTKPDQKLKPKPEPHKEKPVPAAHKTDDDDSDENETCCYILKIVIGVFLILLLTFGTAYFKKRREQKQ